MEEKLVFTGDAKQLEAEYAKLDKAATNQANKLEWIANQAQRMGDEMGKSSKEAIKALDQAAKEAGKLELAHRRVAQVMKDVESGHLQTAAAAQKQEQAHRQALETAKEAAQADYFRFQQLKTIHTREAEAAANRKTYAAQEAAAAASRRVHFTQEADAAAKRHTDLTREAQAMRSVAEQAGSATDEIQEQPGLLAQAGAGALRYLSTWASITAVISEAGAKLDRIQASREKTSQLQSSIAREHGTSAANSGNQSIEGFVQDQKSVEEIVRRNRWGLPNAIEHAAGVQRAAFNATMGDQAISNRIADLSIRMSPHDPNAAKYLAGAIGLSVSKLGISPEEAAAPFVGSQGVSLVDDPAKAYEALGVAASAGASGSRNPKEGARQAQAAWAALTRNPDLQGDMTATEVANLNNILDDISKEGLDRPLRPGEKSLPGYTPKYRFEGMPLDMYEQAKYLQALPEGPKKEAIRKKLKTTGRGKLDAEVVDMFTRADSPAAMNLERANQEVNYDVNNVDLQIAKQSATPAQRANLEAMAAGTLPQVHRANDTIESRQLAAINLVNEYQSQTESQTTWLSRWQQMPRRFMNWDPDNPEQWALDEVHKMRQQVDDEWFPSERDKVRKRQLQKRGDELIRNLSADVVSRAVNDGTPAQGADIVHAINETNRLLKEQIKATQGAARTPGLAPAANADRGRNRE